MKRPALPATLADPLFRIHALVVGTVLATSLGFEHLGGRHLGQAGGAELSAADRLVALEVVLIPLAIAALYVRSRGRRWAEYGLGRPRPGWRSGAAVVVAAGCTYVLAPGAAVPGALALALVTGEELLRRGFLLNEVAALLGGGRRGAAAAVVLLAALSTLGHLHAGAAAGLAAGGAGLVLGALYLATGRSLWSVVVARGLAEAALLVT